jgi:homoserine dehydrogenase
VHKLASGCGRHRGGCPGIYVEGIRDISPEDIAFAKEFGYTVKLLAIAKESSAGFEARVHPTMIPSHYLLATVDGANNAIYVKGDFVGASMSYGQGAGMLPTASAVVSDVIEISRNLLRGSSGRIPRAGSPSSTEMITGIAPSKRCSANITEDPRRGPAGRSCRASRVCVAASIACLSPEGEGGNRPIYIVTHRAKEKPHALTPSRRWTSLPTSSTAPTDPDREQP